MLREYKRFLVRGKSENLIPLLKIEFVCCYLNINIIINFKMYKKLYE